jgi:hypothetical protein
MKRFALAAGLALAIAPAAHAESTTPAPTDAKNAAKYCKALKTASGPNFTAAVDAVVTGKVTAKNAYGKCVSFYAKDQAKKTAKAQKAAKAACKSERNAAGKKGNAYGKCVSKAAKAKKDEADAKDAKRISAAKQCKTARAADKAAFDKQYRNFGTCVSEKAKAQHGA